MKVTLKDNHSENWLVFENPIEIVSSYYLDEIKNKLIELDKFNEKYYLAGHLSYEAAWGLAGYSSSTADSVAGSPSHSSTTLPLIQFGIYRKPKKLKNPFPTKQNNLKLNSIDWKLNIDQTNYIKIIQSIKKLIKQGETYQVNYTLRKEADFTDDPLKLFQIISSHAPYAALIETDDFTVCSASLELFFSLSGKTIRCQPMKGTAPRGRYTEQDIAWEKWLAESKKNRAENLMIVDMMRNDLAKIAKVGSVKVEKLFEVTRHEHLHQMTSSIRATTQVTKVKFSEIINALFPCGSITGAPKLNTMKIIESIENAPREIYTGSMGYLAPHSSPYSLPLTKKRQGQFNVAIRTAWIKDQKIHYGVGGGIVADSDPLEEYAECLLKAKNISNITLQKNQDGFSLIETILWEGKYFLLSYHLTRLKKSANYFNFSLNIKVLKQTLKLYDAKLNQLGKSKKYKVRLILSKSGKFKLEKQSLNSSKPQSVKKIKLALKPIDKNLVWLYHKTTERKIYQAALDEIKKIDSTLDDALLWNEDQEITEFTLGNVIIKTTDDEGRNHFYTPPISSGILPGTYREYLLKKKIIKEKIIKLSNLKSANEIYFINSVRKWVLVKLTH